MPRFCSYHILSSSVIYYDAQQHRMYLLFIIKKQTTTDKAFFYFKVFRHNSKAGLCPLWWTRKKPFDVIYCVYKMRQTHWLLCVVVGPGKSRHCHTWLESPFSWNENLQRKQNWTAKSSNLKKKNTGKVKSVFFPRKAWTLPSILQELKEYTRKTCACSQHWRPFDSSFEWKER